MSTSTDNSSPFLTSKYSPLTNGDMEVQSPSLAISQNTSLDISSDKTVKNLFTADNQYTEKTFANGVNYESFCFHAPLGTYAFDGILDRIIQGKDKFKKALVLTNNFHQAKELGKRLYHKSLTSCKEEYPEATKIPARTRAASSIEKEKNLGVEANDDQILFYDIDQFRTNLGSKINNSSKNDFKLAKKRLNDTISKNIENLDKEKTEAERKLEQVKNQEAKLKIKPGSSKAEKSQVRSQRERYKEERQKLKSKVSDLKKRIQTISKDSRDYLNKLESAFNRQSAFPNAASNSELKRIIDSSKIIDDLMQNLNSASEFADRTIEKYVSELIEKENLSGTEQIYINNAEEFKTDLGYKIIQELAKQLKISNAGEDLRIGALAHFNYNHGEDLSLKKVFGNPIFLHPPEHYQKSAIIPKTEITASKFLGDKESVNSAELKRVTEDARFNTSLLKQAKSRLAQGDQRVFIRVNSNNALKALEAAINRDRDKNKKSGVSLGWISNGKAQYIDKEGVCHNLSSPAQLINNWGKNFTVLAHSGYFDGLEEPADSVITATKIKSPDKFELLSTPLSCKRKDAKEKNHLVFYRFGKDKAHQQDPTQFIKDINQRHRSQGKIERRLSSGKRSFETAKFTLQDSLSEDDIKEGLEWSSYPEELRHFWIQRFGSVGKILTYIRAYINEQDTENKINGDKSLKENEINYVWNLINLTNNFSNAPVLEHNRREVLQKIFKLAGQDFEIFVPSYSSILGVKRLSEAKARVSHVYNEIYQDIEKSKTNGLLEDIDSLYDGRLNFKSKKKHRSSLIADFLFNNGYIDLLTEQDVDHRTKNFTNGSLQATIKLLCSCKPAENQVEEKTLSEFKDFVAERKSLDDTTNWGISKKEASDLVEQYILDYETELLEDDNALEKRINELRTSFLNAEPLRNQEETESFYDFIAVYCSKISREDIIKKHKGLIPVDDAEDARIFVEELEEKINKPSPNSSPVVSNWFDKFAELDQRSLSVANFLFEKRPELFQEENASELAKTVQLLYGAQKTCPVEKQKLFREFVSFVCDTRGAELNSVVSKTNGKTLSKEKLSTVVASSNPGLYGINDRSRLILCLRKKVLEDFRKFCQRNPYSLNANYYRKAAKKFEAISDIKTYADSLGISVNKLISLYFPESIEGKYKKSVELVIAKIESEGKDSKGIKEKILHEINEHQDLIAKALIFNDLLKSEKHGSLTLDAEFPFNEEHILLTFNQNKIVYQQYFDYFRDMTLTPTKEVLNPVNSEFSCELNLGSDDVNFYDYQEVWNHYLDDMTNQAVDTLWKESSQEQRQALVAGASTISSFLDPTAQTDPIKGRTELRNRLKTLETSLCKELQIDRNGLFELFKNYLMSDSFKHNKPKIPEHDIVPRFLELLYGWGDNEHEISLAPFLNYLTRENDNFNVINIIKELALNNSFCYQSFAQNYKAIQTILQKVDKEKLGEASCQTIAQLSQSTGVDFPALRRLRVHLRTEIEKKISDEKERENLEKLIDKQWVEFCSTALCINLFNLTTIPSLTYTQGSKYLNIEYNKNDIGLGDLKIESYDADEIESLKDDLDRAFGNFVRVININSGEID